MPRAEQNQEGMYLWFQITQRAIYSFINLKESSEPVSSAQARLALD
jgi:hypothetical protein